MFDPIARYPEIATDNSGSPMSCQGEALESEPQLAIANQLAAGFGNYLIWTWFGMSHNNEETVRYLPIEFQSTFSRMQTLTIEDIDKLNQQSA